MEKYILKSSEKEIELNEKEIIDIVFALKFMSLGENDQMSKDRVDLLFDKITKIIFKEEDRKNELS